MAIETITVQVPGIQGPQGEMGPQGPQGEPGGAGSPYGYGVRYDKTTDTMVKGIYQGGQFTESAYTAYPIQSRMRRCVLAADGSVAYYLHPGDSTKKADGTAANLTGADGQVMVEIPAFYSRLWEDGDYQYFIVGESQFLGGELDPAFVQGGVERTERYIGAFEGVLYSNSGAAYIDGDGTSSADTGNDKIESIPGFTPWTYQTRSNFRALCGNSGPAHLQDFWLYQALRLLFVTEYATWNSQTALPGYTEASAWDYAHVRATGRTLSMGNASGSVMANETDDADIIAAGIGITAGSSVIANSYRGIENPFGHIWKFVDGINFNDWDLYTCDDPANFADDTVSNYIQMTDQDGNVVHLPESVEGYQKLLWSGTMMPQSVNDGAGSGTYVTDYYWGNDDGWRVLRVGGDLSHGGLAGLAFLSFYSSSGFRLSHCGARPAA
jgi:hypothetical protein